MLDYLLDNGLGFGRMSRDGEGSVCAQLDVAGRRWTGEGAWHGRGQGFESPQLHNARESRDLRKTRFRGRLLAATIHAARVLWLPGRTPPPALDRPPRSSTARRSRRRNWVRSAGLRWPS